MLDVRRRIVALSTALGLAVVQPASGVSAPAEAIDFATQVAPILRQSCIDCHGPTMQMAGLRLDLRSLAFAGGDSGEAIKPGDSEASLLVQRLKDRKLGILMPPSFSVLPGEPAALPAEKIRLLERWVDQGAAWPQELSLSAPPESSSDTPQSSALFAAIRANDRDTLQKLLADKSLLEAGNKDGSTPLMLAALYADADLLRWLAAQGADVNAANRDGVTALMWAAGDAEKVRELLARGAKVDARSELGRTPLLIAATYAGNAEVVRLLLEKGAKAQDQDTMRETPLTSAAKRGDADVVRMLIEAGADLQAGSRPPLVWAAEEGSVAAIKQLLEHGAGHSRESVNEALFSASVRGPIEVVEVLLAAGADPSASVGFGGYTPLMGAAYSESAGTEIVRLLLDNGADFKAKAANGETVFSLAHKHGRTSTVELLTDMGATE